MADPSPFSSVRTEFVLLRSNQYRINIEASVSREIGSTPRAEVREQIVEYEVIAVRLRPKVLHLAVALRELRSVTERRMRQQNRSTEEFGIKRVAHQRLSIGLHVRSRPSN